MLFPLLNFALLCLEIESAVFVYVSCDQGRSLGVAWRRLLTSQATSWACWFPPRDIVLS